LFFYRFPFELAILFFPIFLLTQMRRDDRAATMYIPATTASTSPATTAEDVRRVAEPHQ
jgi:hypothetical protein